MASGVRLGGHRYRSAGLPCRFPPVAYLFRHQVVRGWRGRMVHPDPVWTGPCCGGMEVFSGVVWVRPRDTIPMTGVDIDLGVAPGCPEAVVLAVEMFSCWICCPTYWDRTLPEVPPVSSS
ncbi:hypothetical protein L1987_23336 [Smallanthus sonchifolius]|uniref:Uncharacterized protein n=1 Tax=Smallanthus sonchifolius TaxID=185202 RepID=A0ACB9IHJ2_9ASTR|nr:hypothetical protein L1987_23336 [Smallanthus sonchifolius]